MSNGIIITGVGSATLANSIASMRDSGSKLPATRVIVGGFITVVLLLILAERNPKLAESFALLIAIASFVGPNGEAITDTINVVTEGDSGTLTPRAPFQTLQFNPPTEPPVLA